MLGHLSLSRLRHSLMRAATLLIKCYGIVITLLLVLKFSIGEQWIIIALFNSVLHLLLLPAIAILPYYLLQRRWRMVVFLMPAAIAFVAIYGVFFLPRTVSLASNEQQVSIMTYNLHAESRQLQPMLDVIRSTHADIVALQELSPAAANQMEASLSNAYPYQSLHPNAINPIWGQGILSRYPIQADEYWHINLGHQRAVLEVGRQTLTVYNTHPIHPFLFREGRGFDPEPRR